MCLNDKSAEKLKLSMSPSFLDNNGASASSPSEKRDIIMNMGAAIKDTH